MSDDAHEGSAAGERGIRDIAAAASEPDAKEETESGPERLQRLHRERCEVIVDLLLDKGLYSTVDVSTDVGEWVEKALREAKLVTFDTYCIGCRDQSTFRIQGNPPVATRSIGGRYAENVILPALFAVQAVCQRAFHPYTYVFAVEHKKLMKIGQRPSLADISHGELRGIDKSLDADDRRELGTALGLFAHGTALGAFVYLRRVFERMVHRAHERQSAAGHPVDGFDGMHMDERIAALKDELPKKVVQNSAVFSVLSVGLHELTEEQCAQYFPVLKAVLFQMLEQEEHKRKAAITARETDAALQRILSGVAEKGTGAE